MDLRISQKRRFWDRTSNWRVYSRRKQDEAQKSGRGLVGTNSGNFEDQGDFHWLEAHNISSESSSVSSELDKEVIDIDDEFNEQ